MKMKRICEKRYPSNFIDDFAYKRSRLVAGTVSDQNNKCQATEHSFLTIQVLEKV